MSQKPVLNRKSLVQYVHLFRRDIAVHSYKHLSNILLENSWPTAASNAVYIAACRLKCRDSVTGTLRKKMTVQPYVNTVGTDQPMNPCRLIKDFSVDVQKYPMGP